LAEPVGPVIDQELCIACGDCAPSCPQDALSLVEGAPQVDLERCTYCGACESACPVGAIALPFEIVLITPGEGDEHGEG